MWTSGPDLPFYSLFDHCQVLLGDTVYITGGGQRKTLKLTRDGNWVEVGSLSVARDDFACAVHAEKIFVIGGSGSDADLSSVEIFDPASETWTFGPEFPQALHRAQAVSWDGSLWVMGGWNRTISGYNDMLYRLEENVWKNTEITVLAHWGALPALIVDNDIINC